MINLIKNSCPCCGFNFNDWFITNGISTPYGSGGEWARYCFRCWDNKKILIKEQRCG
jgi:hypothetical protein